MVKKLSEKLRAKFPATTPDCSIVENACLDDASLEDFYLKASPVGGQSLQRREKKLAVLATRIAFWTFWLRHAQKSKF